MDEIYYHNTERRTATGFDWMSHIEDVYLGRWINPLTGESAPRSKCRLIKIADSLDGEEAEIVKGAGLQGPLAIVADQETWDVMGKRVASCLEASGESLERVILESKTHATLPAVNTLADRLKGVNAVVAVGSGTVNDLVKYITSKDGRKYCIFGTAASMDGYTSTTASLTLTDGLKVSYSAHSPCGVFLEIETMASAPQYMSAAGYGDTLCTSVSRIDWWMSHRLTGSYYDEAPYLITEPDAGKLAAFAKGVGDREHEAIGWLTRSLVLSGLGVGFTGISNHGSMGEHQVSHYIDCFAKDLHPGSLHGQQVGVATLSMARIQQWFIDQEHPPLIKPTKIDSDDMARRMGQEAAAVCEKEYRKKAVDAEGAAELNEKLQEIWPDLRSELRQWVVPVSEMQSRLTSAGGAVSAGELGLPVEFYREAVRHGHEMRNRYSFADLACGAGLLDDFAAEEI